MVKHRSFRLTPGGGESLARQTSQAGCGMAGCGCLMVILGGLVLGGLFMLALSAS